jgi:hypothetical protein
MHPANASGFQADKCCQVPASWLLPPKDQRVKAVIADSWQRCEIAPAQVQVAQLGQAQQVCTAAAM